MRVINHNWSSTKQRLHPQSVAEISRHSVLSGDKKVKSSQVAFNEKTMSIAQLYNVEKKYTRDNENIQLKKTSKTVKRQKTKAYIQIQVQDKCEKGWNY